MTFFFVLKEIQKIVVEKKFLKYDETKKKTIKKNSKKIYNDKIKK